LSAMNLIVTTNNPNAAMSPSRPHIINFFIYLFCFRQQRQDA
jgi:hypothetical protein